MGLVLVTPPASEPLSVAEAKNYLRIDTDDEDGLIGELIKSARDFIESHTRRQLVTATWREIFDRFPEDSCPIRLSRSPVQTVGSVKYRDPADILQTLSASVFKVDGSESRARIALKELQEWPDTREEIAVVEVEYTAGYGTQLQQPPVAKSLIRYLVNLMHEHREPTIVGFSTLVNELPFGVQTWIQAQLDKLSDGEYV